MTTNVYAILISIGTNLHIHVVLVHVLISQLRVLSLFYISIVFNPYLVFYCIS